jgi:hypothetical protein
VWSEGHTLGVGDALHRSNVLVEDRALDQQGGRFELEGQRWFRHA